MALGRSGEVLRRRRAGARLERSMTTRPPSRRSRVADTRSVLRASSTCRRSSSSRSSVRSQR
eukprot:3830919-Rhodomonas_salina.2